MRSVLCARFRWQSRKPCRPSSASLWDSMHSMATEMLLKRRTVLSAAGAAMLGGAVSLRGFSAAARTEPGVRCGSFVTAARIGDIDRAAIISADSVSDFALPARAHAAVALPRTGEVLLVGRRPGAFAAFAEIGPTPREIRLVLPISG